MADLLAEVDDVMRQEKLEKLWTQHGSILIAIVVTIILATAAYAGYKSWNTSVKTADTKTLLSVLESPSFPEDFDPSKLDIRPSLKAIATLSAASNYLDLENTEKAQELYKIVATDENAPKSFKDLATLMYARLAIQNNTEENNAGQTNVQSTLTLLESVWKDTRSPWRYHAFIEAAVIEARNNGNFEKAREYLNIVLDTENLLDALYARAQALHHVYSLQNKNPQN